MPYYNQEPHPSDFAVYNMKGNSEEKSWAQNIQENMEVIFKKIVEKYKENWDELTDKEKKNFIERLNKIINIEDDR